MLGKINLLEGLESHSIGLILFFFILRVLLEGLLETDNFEIIFLGVLLLENYKEVMFFLCLV